MSAAFDVYDLDMEWRTAPDGFLDGNSFKTWLCLQVLQLRAQAARVEALDTALREIEAAWINKVPDAALVMYTTAARALNVEDEK